MKLREPRPNPAPKPTRTIRWTWFYRNGEYNPAIRSAARGANGVYGFRERKSGIILYIGESHTGRLWKTMIRHFHALDSFEEVGEWTHENRSSVQVKLWLTRTGDDAVELEADRIRRHRPLMVERIPGDEEDEDEEAPF